MRSAEKKDYIPPVLTPVCLSTPDVCALSNWGEGDEDPINFADWVRE